MDSKSQPAVDENGIPEVRQQDVVKEGYLSKQSRYLKEWRK